MNDLAKPSHVQHSADMHALAEAEAWARAGRIEEALEACQALFPRLKAAGDRVGLGTCEHIMAASHQYGGRVKESILSGYRAIEWLRGTDAIDRQVKVLALQSGGLARVGAAPEALELLDQAIRMLPDAGADPRQQCVFWTNAAAAYDALKYLPQALDAAKCALDLTSSIDDAALARLCRGNAMSIGLELLCEDPLKNGEPIRHALAQLKSHLHALQAEGHHHLVPYIVEPAADALLLLEDHVEARSWLDAGVVSTQATGSRPAQGLLEMRLARIDRIESRFESARAHLARALGECDATQTLDGQELIHQEHSLLCEAIGDWRGALESYKKRSKLREDSLRLQAEVRTQALAAQLDLERGRVEAELLRHRNDELRRGMTRLADRAGELQRQAMEDPLTGLANRRQLDIAVQDLTLRKPGILLTMMVIDIDHFKKINDNWSHATGDRVLKALALLMREGSRPDDVVARMGGEEFVVVFGESVKADRAVRIAERLRERIQDHDWCHIESGLAVTASIGVAQSRAGEQIGETLERADAALYQCKNAGRNQVRFVA